MSYSEELKTEIMANTQLHSECCALSECSAMAALSGTLRLGRGGATIRFSSEHPAVIRRILTHLKRLTGDMAEAGVRKHSRLAMKNEYTAEITDTDKAAAFLKAAGLIDVSGGINMAVPVGMLKSGCCRFAYLRGAFLAAGTMASPEKSYQTAIYSVSEEYAQSLRAFMEAEGLNAKTGTRRDGYVVYLKDSESIVDFLSMMGASSAVFNMENTRIVKDIKNNVNRAMNCESANFEKSSRAAREQTQDIMTLIESGVFTKLSKDLRETAEARLEYPEATLEEIGEALVPAKGKSCINHRMAKIKKLAQMAREAGEQL